MPPFPADDIEAFLNHQERSTLVNVLVELAKDHEAVQARLTRLRLADRSDELASDFRKTLDAWRRSSTLFSNREADEFGRKLEAWLGQVERELLPKEPAAAVALFESFIESDATFFECADDSYGAISDAVRAVLSYTPQPNERQQQDFADAFLEADRPADALTWLRGPWEHSENTRQRLESDALGRLGRHSESAPIRQCLFEQSMSVSDLHSWLEHLPEALRHDALEQARQLALDHDDPAKAATLLLDIGDDEAAEAMLLANATCIRGNDCGALVPLAQSLNVHQRLRGEAVL